MVFWMKWFLGNKRVLYLHVYNTDISVLSMPPDTIEILIRLKQCKICSFKNLSWVSGGRLQQCMLKFSHTYNRVFIILKYNWWAKHLICKSLTKTETVGGFSSHTSENAKFTFLPAVRDVWPFSSLTRFLLISDFRVSILTVYSTSIGWNRLHRKNCN